MISAKELNWRKPFLSLSLALVVGAAYVSAQTAQPARAEAADNEHQTGAVLWHQTSGEMRALSYQAYNLARMMLDRDLQVNRRVRRPRAVIVDVDETVLDNSRHQAALILDRENFNAARWTQWCNRAEATALPGAVEFLRYAAARRVRIFYVTNRRAAEREGTRRNLVRLGFPDVTDETLLVREEGTSGGKETRRRRVADRFRVVLLVGDNLNDFTDVFERQSVEDRATQVDRLRREFGTRFIVIPNVMYGDWESALYDYNPRLTESERATRRRERLRGY